MPELTNSLYKMYKNKFGDLTILVHLTKLVKMD